MTLGPQVPILLGLCSGDPTLKKSPLKTGTPVSLVQKAYQKQILLILADNDCLIVERSGYAPRVSVEVKEGRGIENAINLVKAEKGKGDQLMGQCPQVEIADLRPWKRF